MADNQMCFFKDILKEVTPEENLKDLEEIWPDNFKNTLDLSLEKYQKNYQTKVNKFMDRLEIDYVELPFGMVRL